MFPCIGQMVVARRDDVAHEKAMICRICGKPLTDLDHNPAKRAGICRVCYGRLMKFMPHRTH